MKSVRFLSALGAVVCLLLSALSAHALTEAELKQLKEELSSLQRRVETMQKLIERQEKALEAIQREKRDAPQTASAPGAGGASTLTGISRNLNPAISVNGLFLGAASKNRRPIDQEPGLFIQEAELRADAFVDPNVLGSLTIAIENEESGEFEFDLEELYFDIFGVPSALLPEGARNQIEGVSLRVGKAFVPFGKNNPLHTHQLPFIDRPLVNQRIFGEESLNEVLGQLNVSLPTPFFLEFQGAVMDGRNEALFNSPRSKDLAGFVRGHALFDLTPNTTAEIGSSFTLGENEALRQNRVVGGDLTVKSVRGQTRWPHQVIWTSEYIAQIQDQGKGLDDDTRGGLYSELQVQVHRNWWLQGRYEYFGLPKFDAADREWKGSLLAALVPNDFSAIRLQYNYVDDGAPAVRDVHEFFVQFNYTFGSHPAHKY